MVPVLADRDQPQVADGHVVGRASGGVPVPRRRCRSTSASAVLVLAAARGRGRRARRRRGPSRRRGGRRGRERCRARSPRWRAGASEQTGADLARRGWQASIGRNLPAVPRTRTLPPGPDRPPARAAAPRLRGARRPAPPKSPRDGAGPTTAPPCATSPAPRPAHCVAVGQRGMVLRSKHAGDDGARLVADPARISGGARRRHLHDRASASRSRTPAMLRATYTSQGLPLRRRRRDLVGRRRAAARTASPKTRSALALACDGDGRPVTRSGRPAASGARPTAASPGTALDLPPRQSRLRPRRLPERRGLRGGRRRRRRLQRRDRRQRGDRGRPAGEIRQRRRRARLRLGDPLHRRRRPRPLLRCSTWRRRNGATAKPSRKRRSVVGDLLPAGRTTASASPGRSRCAPRTLGAGTWKRRPIGTLEPRRARLRRRPTASPVGEHAELVRRRRRSASTGAAGQRSRQIRRRSSAAADLGNGCVAGGEKDIGVSPPGGELWPEPLSGLTGLNVKSVNCTGLSECLLPRQDAWRSSRQH